MAFAADLVGKYEAELVLVTVAPEPATVSAPGVSEYARIEGIRDAISQYGQFGRASRARRGLDEGGQGPQARDRDGARCRRPGGRDHRRRKDRQADLIVVGSPGRGRLAGLLLGSVAQKVISPAQKVISLAPCPVTVMR